MSEATHEEAPPLWKTELSLVPLAISLLVFFLFPGSWSEQPQLQPILSTVVFILLLLVMVWGAFSVVRHAEALATILGEPLGTLILTLSVILIEVAMIVALLLTGPEDNGVVRDTMFAVLMIVLNGMVGLCLLAGGLRHGQPLINLQGAGAFLSALVVLGSVSLILPTVTVSRPGGEPSHLLSVFLVIASVVSYGVFLFVQTGRYRGWFKGEDDDGSHGHDSVLRSVPVHGIFLALNIIPIVMLAKKLATFVDTGIYSLDLPPALGGMVVAIIVLSPEAMVAFHAARQNLLQRSVNVCLGSGLATIGLTVPAVLGISFFTDHTIELGLKPWNALLLGTTFLLSMLSFNTGRTNYLQGVLHLVLFGAYIVLVFE